jgi:hypothetical protein
VTIRDDDDEALAERVAAITRQILESGGTPVTRRYRNGPAAGKDSRDSADPPDDKPPEKTYIDSRGVRRCNLQLNNSRRCNQPVTEKEGRYGLFWSCPNYKEHAPPPPR